MNYRKITPKEAKQQIDQETDLIILDVRTQEEYNACHIKDAILIPNDTLTDKRPELLSDLKANILVYCRSGVRSQEAAEKLTAMGYQNVSDFGGILQWPYEVISSSPKS